MSEQKGEVIRMLRMAIGLSVTQFADKLDVDAELINLVENGQLPVSGILLRKMAESLQIPLSSLELLISDACKMKVDESFTDHLAETIQGLEKMENQLRTLLHKEMKGKTCQPQH